MSTIIEYYPETKLVYRKKSYDDDGNPTGTEYIYSKTGAVISKYRWKNGLLHGKCYVNNEVHRYINGKKVNEYLYSLYTT